MRGKKTENITYTTIKTDCNITKPIGNLLHKRKIAKKNLKENIQSKKMTSVHKRHLRDAFDPNFATKGGSSKARKWAKNHFRKYTVMRVHCIAEPIENEAPPNNCEEKSIKPRKKQLAPMFLLHNGKKNSRRPSLKNPLYAWIAECGWGGGAFCPPFWSQAYSESFPKQKIQPSMEHEHEDVADIPGHWFQK